jgi:hypothetical protein
MMYKVEIHLSISKKKEYLLNFNNNFLIGRCSVLYYLFMSLALLFGTASRL